ncbi:hypothetical protein K7X08_026092 [Anisodus acutangulus]|uniref:Uncharacterized protein n=1 Tax=Anisodus acutangulus TaxID=402998 RepID=A0A9Q1N1W5_9SOLA|nr:hypothetical protein K7X08_026092 [Anisodus acutangulus]
MAETTLSTTEKRFLILKSSNNDKCELEESIAIQLEMIKNMVEDGCTTSVIPLANEEEVANRIKDKSLEVVREIFNITSDFTLEEEAEIRNENPSASKGILTTPLTRSYLPSYGRMQNDY